MNDLRRWQDWSPWAKKDPNATATFAGPTAGEGSSFTWSGNDEIGEGTMTITESEPSELVRIKLDFVQPMEATNFSEFDFHPQGDQTENNFLGRLVCTFMNMDEMVGSDFEKGLAQLKTVSETSAEEATSDEANAADETTAEPTG